MSKTTDHMLDEQQKIQNFNEKEAEYLEQEYVEPFMNNQQITRRFGSFNEYLIALARPLHPRHKEANKIRDRRMEQRGAVIHDDFHERMLRIQEENHLARLADRGY